ncbi:DUF3667 domain-containing protein [Hirschia maritima]|uniref:DUF3667 domain-containing protein n=1 Tax=Hirschia maritima TaxID=1121961 RepID=UPI0003665585|nr:DUF3667 domain-containing protein [Hirschia maritima]
MSDEVEAGGLWGLARSFRAGKKSKPAFEHCQNCGTELTGPYCHACGQLADDFHRPIWSLVREGFTDLLSLDGRLWKTLPQLLFRPGHVTRQYIDGKRASQVPPFRLYLIASLIFFSTFFLFGPSGDDVETLFGATPSAQEACEKGREAAQNDPDALAKIEEMCQQAKENALEERTIGQINLGEGREELSKRIQENGDMLLKEPQRFWLLVQSWAPRIAFLLLPFLVIGLAVLFPFKRNVYVYDHVVLSLHYLTMLFLLWTTTFILPSSVAGWYVWVLMLYPFFYMYKSLRVVFDGGRVLSFLRSLILWGGSFLVVLFLAMITVATVTIAA